LILCVSLMLFSADTPFRMGMLGVFGVLLVRPAWIAVRGVRERRYSISMDESGYSIHLGDDVVESTAWADVGRLHHVGAMLEPHLLVTDRASGRRRRIYYELEDVSDALACIASSVRHADDAYALPFRAIAPPLLVEKWPQFIAAAALLGMGVLAFVSDGGAGLLWIFGPFSALLVGSTISKRRSEPDAISVSADVLALESARSGNRVTPISGIKEITFRSSRIRRNVPAVHIDGGEGVGEVDLDISWVDPVRLYGLLVRQG
jgi:hypothetical protein